MCRTALGVRESPNGASEDQTRHSDTQPAGSFSPVLAGPPQRLLTLKWLARSVVWQWFCQAELDGDWVAVHAEHDVKVSICKSRQAVGRGIQQTKADTTTSLLGINDFLWKSVGRSCCIILEAHCTYTTFLVVTSTQQSVFLSFLAYRVSGQVNHPHFCS